MLAVERSVLAISVGMPGDRVEWHLLNWRDWMYSGQYAGLRLPGRASGMGYSHGADVDQLGDIADRTAARAVDAIIRDLKPLEQKALRCEYLAEEWTSPTPHELVLVLAREAVRAGLDRRGIV